MMTIGSVVASGKRIGRVICIDSRGRVLVMWRGSSIAGWNRRSGLKLIA
jgi:hypothetical protein